MPSQWSYPNQLDYCNRVDHAVRQTPERRNTVLRSAISAEMCLERLDPQQGKRRAGSPSRSTAKNIPTQRGPSSMPLVPTTQAARGKLEEAGRRAEEQMNGCSGAVKSFDSPLSRPSASYRFDRSFKLGISPWLQGFPPKLYAHMRRHSIPLQQISVPSQISGNRQTQDEVKQR